jgi:hypothetical protein
VRDPWLVVDDFFEEGEALRAAFEAYFADSDRKSGPSRQVWDYWYVPGLYTYLRTEPSRLLPAELLGRFMGRVQAWAAEQLGMSAVSPPYLSLYVHGCGQGLHNDAGNGRWGFVYSLTRWERRNFTGGETLLFRDRNYWETLAMARPGAGQAFYDLIPARFNQLLFFDDRLIHAVPHLMGTPAPCEGRVVLHGHVREGGIQVRGALSRTEAELALDEPMQRVRSRIQTRGPCYHGCASFRLAVEPEGRVGRLERLSDRVFRLAPDAADPERVLAELAGLLGEVRFPPAVGPSLVTVPIPLEPA